MDLEWNCSVPATGLYAALAMHRGCDLVDRALAAALRPAAVALAARFAECGAPPELLLRRLVAFSVDSADPLTVAAKLLETLPGGHALNRESLADALTRLASDLGAARPRLADELPLRIEPLRSQWEARGPGLLAAMRRLTNGALLVPAAGLTLVHPVLGGGGEAQPAARRVTFEAVLANPIAELPEVLRLGWLLGQLNCAASDDSAAPGRESAQIMSPRALIPIVLAAAEEVELARADDATLSRALSAWLGANPERGNELGT